MSTFGAPNPLPVRIASVAMAAGADINDELTIIVNCCDELREFVAAAEIRQAAQRIAWKTSGLLNYGRRNGGRASNCTVERLILDA